MALESAVSLLLWSYYGSSVSINTSHMHYHPTLSLGTVVGARQVPLYFSRQVLPPQFGGTGPSLWTTSLLGVVLGGDLPGGDQTAVVVFAGEVFVSLV